jgi:hypothetical protein
MWPNQLKITLLFAAIAFDGALPSSGRMTGARDSGSRLKAGTTRGTGHQCLAGQVARTSNSRHAARRADEVIE